MPVRLADVLAHPVVRQGAPSVLAGGDRLDREVRWLHSSDIFEIAPLLRGGDLLLTTGLGLIGRNAADARSFVRSLAQRGVAALVLETCRFYTCAPDEMVTEAERVGLPMVGFDRVVPFVEVTEALNGAIVDAAVHRLRHADEVSQQLSSVLVGGGGVPEALDRLSQVLAAPTRFIRVGGLGGATGSPAEVAEWPELPDAVPVMVHGVVAGWLRTNLTGRDRSLGQAALERAATALSLAILRDERTVAAAASGRRHLAGQLLEPDSGVSAVRAALREAGLPVDARYVTVIGTGTVVDIVAAALDRACAAAAPASSSVTAVAPGSDYAVSVIAVADAAATVVTDVRLALETSTPLGGDALAAIGPVACGVDDLARSAQEARLSLQAVWARAPRTRVVECSRMGLERALLHGHDHDQLQALADEHLGPLLAYDERRGTRLVDTLRAMLESPDGKAGAAARLHIRRQSLYQRLSRIRGLLAVDLDDPGVRSSLLVALHALDLSATAGQSQARR